jgi:4-amino-4-deoxy-L-arabinose transferase-like glycosyltransferase
MRLVDGPERAFLPGGFSLLSARFGESMATTTGDQRANWRANGLGALIDFAVASHVRAVALLGLVAFIAFAPGLFAVPPIDRDEARFAQATKQMVETGDFVDIRFQDVARYKKPVGIYWLQAGVVKAADALGKRNAHTTIGLYRIPSFIGAIGAVLLTYWTALAFVSRRAAVLAGLMMASSILLGIEARLAKTDAMLLATVVAAMGALARAYLGEYRPSLGLPRWIVPAVFWTALAGGVLLKGPLILMIVGFTIVTVAAIDRSVRWLLALQPLPGLLWFAVLVLPWFVSIMSRDGDAFVAESLGQDLLPKLFSSQEGHGGPPGLYFLLFWVMFWPAATLAGIAAPAIWASRREKGARFLLAWLVPAWIVFELVVTKLPHYVLPLYPAIAILLAGVVDSHRLARNSWMERGTAWWFALPVIVGIVAVAGLILFGRRLGVLAWPFAAGAIIMGLLAWRLYEADGALRSLLRAMVASLLISISLFGIVLPTLSALFPSLTLARALQLADCENPMVAAAGYHEPSLVFLIGTSTRLVDGAGAADFLRPGGCRFAFVEARQERGFLRRADTTGLRYSPGPRIDGYSYNAGRWVSIAIYRAGPGQ